jgi:hypothetical protein
MKSLHVNVRGIFNRPANSRHFVTLYWPTGPAARDREVRCDGATSFLNICCVTSLVAWWSELLTINHELPSLIPGSALGIFPCRGRSPSQAKVLRAETSLCLFSHSCVDRIAGLLYRQLNSNWGIFFIILLMFSMFHYRYK